MGADQSALFILWSIGWQETPWCTRVGVYTLRCGTWSRCECRHQYPSRGRAVRDSKRTWRPA